MLFAGELEVVLRELCELLSTKFKIEVETNLVSTFNGLEIIQSRDYIKIHVGKYIDKVLVGHGWEQHSGTSTRPLEPIHPNVYKEVESSEGPVTPTEAAAIEKSAGFSYRTVIGELIFAYVTCRLDIGFAMAELSKFNAAPAACHYAAAKRVCCYLRESKTDIIIVWRQDSNPALPHFPLVKLPIDDIDLLVPYPAAMDHLVGYMDAAHGTCLRTHRSVGGETFCLVGAAILYRSKWIVVICTSSMEAEFVVAVRGGKSAKYLRSILNQLGVQQVGPTLMNVDHESDIAMVNAGRPTERSRHIDIQNFALGQWLKDGDVRLGHIPGKANPSDGLTKPLYHMLHNRHCTLAMGAAGSPYTNTKGRLG
jgi:hypothetical protein